MDDDIEIIDSSDLKLKCIAGGSLTEKPALFGSSGEVLYLIWGSDIKIYSAITGEWIKDLDDNHCGPIVGIHFDALNSKLLIACTRNGSLIFWKSESYVVSHKTKLVFDSPNAFVIQFERVILSDEGTFAAIAYKKFENSTTRIGIFDLSTGIQIQDYSIELFRYDVKIQDGGNGFDYFALCQFRSLYVLDKKSEQFVKHRNYTDLTAICCHPEKEMIATGDIAGKVFLWHNIYSQYPTKTELHWHSMPVSCLKFSTSGTILYSGGDEMVLVKWTLGKSHDKDFLPRFSGGLRHIAVDSRNDKLAISTDDNAVQIINAQFCQAAVVQNFTRVPTYYDFSDQNAFPIGIKLNPRNNCLIMNGRIGFLQFFSTYTQRMLFNMDITLRNLVPRERTKVVYNMRITNVAVSVNWLATVEEWNDNEHSIEIKLRFWEFLTDKQIYSLNTHVELPHQKSITSMEFSSKYDTDNLICATAGNDKLIKIWSLETTENIHKKTKVWMCIEKLTYKNLIPNSLNFSQDGSLLAAGFGNVLCVWDSMTFRLKCTLSAPCCLDGSVNNVLLVLPPQSKTIEQNERMEKIKSTVDRRRKIIDQMKLIVAGEDVEGVLKSLTLPTKQRSLGKHTKKLENSELSVDDKKLIFKRIFMINELNFKQKIQVLQKLNIACEFSGNLEQDICYYLSKSCHNYKDINETIENEIQSVRESERSEIYQFYQKHIQQIKNGHQLLPTRDILGFSQSTDKKNGKISEKSPKKIAHSYGILTKITNVLFCSEELSHLVVVSTPERLLIWNLLTLKLQASYKLSAKCITIDPSTNLIAVFTKINELYVFLPNIAMPIYHRKNMPEIYGAAWVPRKYPKSQSLNVNWQASSQLYFLNANQELSHLISDSDDEILGPVAYFEDFTPVVNKTPFGALMAKQVESSATNKSSNWTNVRLGNSGDCVGELINSSNHTMASMSLLSKEFIRSLLTDGENKREKEAKQKAIESKDKSKKVRRKRFDLFDTKNNFEVSDDDDAMEVDENVAKKNQRMADIEKTIKENARKKDSKLEMKMEELNISAVEDFEL